MKFPIQPTLHGSIQLALFLFILPPSPPPPTHPLDQTDLKGTKPKTQVEFKTSKYFFASNLSSSGHIHACLLGTNEEHRFDLFKNVCGILCASVLGWTCSKVFVTTFLSTSVPGWTSSKKCLTSESWQLEVMAQWAGSCPRLTRWACVHPLQLASFPLALAMTLLGHSTGVGSVWLDRKDIYNN